MNKVQLAVSPLGGIPGFTAYHSSVLVNGEEFSFSTAGISMGNGPQSHSGAPGGASAQLLDLGLSKHSGRKLQSTMAPHFLPGTYDLLRKNCNSFSDCAIFFLLGKRLDQQYRTLDTLGAQNPALLQAVSGGKYSPNPRAECFKLEELIAQLDPEKHWRTPGHSTGGQTASSMEALRNARLARFSGQATTNSTSDVAAKTPSPFPEEPDVSVEVCAASRMPAQGQSSASSEGRVALSRAMPAPGPALHFSVAEDERLARQLAVEEDEALARQLAQEGRGHARQNPQQRESIRQHMPPNPLTQVVAEMDQALNGLNNMLTTGRGRGRGGGVGGSGYPSDQLAQFFESLEEGAANAVRRSGFAVNGRHSRGISAANLDANTARMRFEGPSESVASGGDGLVSENQCAVCYEAFSTGDELRILPCLHRYHCACIDTWLRQHRECPICKHRVTA